MAEQSTEQLLSDLIFLLKEVDWYMLGIHLRVPNRELNIIKQEHTLDRKLAQVLQYWLNNEEVSWEKIIEALKKIGRHANIITTIESKYIVSGQHVSQEKSSGTQVVSKKADYCDEQSLSESVVWSTGMESKAQGVPDKATHSEQSVVTKNKQFWCPCKSCTLDSYLKQGCPRSKTGTFPYLDLGSLSPEAKEDTIQQLENDQKKINKAFADLHLDTCESLKEQQVSISTIVGAILSLKVHESDDCQKSPSLMREYKQELRNAESVDDVFIIARPHWSFFNFDLLAHVIKRLGNDNDHKNLQKYQEQFTEFCKRKVFQVSPHVGQPLELAPERSTFAVLISEEAISTLGDIERAKREIASLLGLKASTLYLHTINKACIILLFSVPEFVAKELFPLDSRVIYNLKAEGFHIFTSTLLNSDSNPNTTAAVINDATIPTETLKILSNQGDGSTFEKNATTTVTVAKGILTLVKKGKNCVAIAKIIHSDLTKGYVEGVEQKLKGLETDAEELAKHAEEKAKEIEEVEGKHRQIIEDTQREIGKLGRKLEELQRNKRSLESTLSNKQSLLCKVSSELSSAVSQLRDAEYELEKAKRETASSVGGGAVIGAIIGTILVPGIGTAFGAAAGAGTGKVINDSEVREARGRVDDCRRRHDNAQAEVNSASSAVFNVQREISSLISKCQKLEHKSALYSEEAKKMKKAVLFFLEASQFWKEFRNVSLLGADRTAQLQKIASKAKEEEDVSWLDSGAGKKTVKSFLDAWEMIETRCDQGVQWLIRRSISIKH